MKKITHGRSSVTIVCLRNHPSFYEGYFTDEPIQYINCFTDPFSNWGDLPSDDIHPCVTVEDLINKKVNLESKQL